MVQKISFRYSAVASPGFCVRGGVAHGLTKSSRVLMGLGSSTQQTGLSGFVQQTVHDNCVVIFSSTTCPHCRVAKEVFKEMGVRPEIVELNQRQDGRDVMEVLQGITGIHTVPQVFVNGQYIGGGVETKQLYKSGQLSHLIEQCILSHS